MFTLIRSFIEQFEIMSRKSSFNLDSFYQELKRADSLKQDFRKTANSPLVKELAKEDKSKPLAAFKKELNRKELAKTKINLDQPYEQFRVNRPNKDHSQLTNNYRFSELSGESRENDPYSNVRERLQRWRREENQSTEQKNRDNILSSNANSKVIQKSEVDQSQYYDFLEKTMETPANEQLPQQKQEASKQDNSAVTQQLLSELTHRNQIYEQVQAHCGQERSYYRKEDPSIKLQEHFRRHKTMENIIQEFKRICGLQITDLHQLYDFLHEGKQVKQDKISSSQQELI